MDIQRLRNLTTGRLHTEIGHVYQDLEMITGEKVIMIHMIPRLIDCVRPWLKRHVRDEIFWNGEYDQTHVGEFDLPSPTGEDRAHMLNVYM